MQSSPVGAPSSFRSPLRNTFLFRRFSTFSSGGFSSTSLLLDLFLFFLTRLGELQRISTAARAEATEFLRASSNTNVNFYTSLKSNRKNAAWNRRKIGENLNISRTCGQEPFAGHFPTLKKSQNLMLSPKLTIRTWHCRSKFRVTYFYKWKKPVSQTNVTKKF